MSDCVVIDEFTARSASAWYAVNDGVMGGRSRGGPAINDENLVFQGVIDTNGGGFSSVRRDLVDADLSPFSKFVLRARTDGRSYQLTVQTEARVRGRPVSHRAPVSGSVAEWSDVSAAFSSLQPFVFGQRLSRPSFDPSKVRSLGFILADGTDGPFRLDVDWIKACP